MMEIQDAMKETGKVECEEYPSYYAEWHGGNLAFLTKAGDKYQGLLAHERILADDWQPYHAKEEIRPSEAGELWELWEYIKNDQKTLWFTIRHGLEEIRMTEQTGQTYTLRGMQYVSHGSTGWKRLHPPVSDAEEIVIEGVTWGRGDGGVIVPAGPGISIKLRAMLDKPPCIMKLSAPKEQP